MAPSSAIAALGAMYNRTRAEGYEVRLGDFGNALIHRARNKALAAMRPEADYVLFCDDDMLPEPDALLRLLSLQVPAVSALCSTRIPPVEIAAKFYDASSHQFLPFRTVNLERPITGKFLVGTAFLLLNRETVNALIEHYLTAQDWLTDHRKELDRMKVRVEQREAERFWKENVRRAKWNCDHTLRVFDYAIRDEEQLGEDVTLCQRLMELGVPVTIDGTTIVGHLGEYPYSVLDIIKDERKPAARAAAL